MNRGVVPAASFAAAILGLATACLVLRLPGSVILMGAASIAAILVTGFRRPERDTWPLWLFLGAATLSSTLSVLIAPANIGLVNSATLATLFTVFAIAVLCGDSGRSISHAVAAGLYYTFGFALAVGWFEAVTGFRLRVTLYPGTSSVPPAGGRFQAAAWFPNYNDLSVVISMFAIMVLLRFLLDARGPLIQLTRGAAFLAACLLIVLAESRGALVALFAGSTLACVQAIRVKHPKLVGGLAVVSAALIAVLLSALVVGSAWYGDNSTRVRGIILANTLDMTPDDSFRFWLGWSDPESFQAAASAVYPGQLMDPHNVLLEIFSWYGTPTLLAFAVLWFVILRRGVWRMEAPTDWFSVAMTIIFTLTPILGIVPSSSLRYYYVFVIAPCVMAIVTFGGQRNRRTDTHGIPCSLPS